METKQPSKKILLVDDDSVFLKGLMYAVKSLGHEPILAESGREAATILSKVPVDLVISDINMPNGNGLQLLNHIMKKNRVPVILMTGLRDLKEAHSAIKMGARFFLSKPFKKTELSEAIVNCLQDSSPSGDKLEEKIKLHLDEFLNGDKLLFPVYMQTHDRLVKISNGGETLSPEVIASCRVEGIDFLMANKEDFIQYLGLKGFDKKAFGKKPLLEKALKCFDHYSSLASLNLNAKRRVLLHFESTFEILLSNPETNILMQELAEDELFCVRNATVAMFSSMIAQYQGNVSTKEYFILMAAGLVHELGLKGIKTDDGKELHEMDPDMQQIMLNHGYNGAQKIRRLGVLPEEVALLVEQHHELEDGSGYPKRLTSKNIHPLAKIITVSDNLAFKLEKNKIDDVNAPKLLHTFILEFMGRHDTKVLEALALVFGQSVPQEFAELQLSQLLLRSEAA